MLTKAAFHVLQIQQELMDALLELKKRGIPHGNPSILEHQWLGDQDHLLLVGFGHDTCVDADSLPYPPMPQGDFAAPGQSDEARQALR